MEFMANCVIEVYNIITYYGKGGNYIHCVELVLILGKEGIASEKENRIIIDIDNNCTNNGCNTGIVEYNSY